MRLTPVPFVGGSPPLTAAKHGTQDRLEKADKGRESRQQRDEIMMINRQREIDKAMKTGNDHPEDEYLAPFKRASGTHEADSDEFLCPALPLLECCGRIKRCLDSTATTTRPHVSAAEQITEVV
ncbi:hypothetical protein K438DRAFT_2071562 [Mycena galopus ATCC 62051]|nr:hypothetical protein K438DRAFT_2071562 [Mycena galopus ATCC 62051]